MILQRVIRPGTLEKIRTWIVESRGPGSRVMLSGRYFILIVDGAAVGAVALDRLSWYATEIKHLVVAPEFRRRGHGRTILRLALEKVRTPVALSTVRAENEWWVYVNAREGFNCIRRLETRSGAILLLVATAPHPIAAGAPTAPADSTESS